MKNKSPDFYEKNPDNYKWGIFYFNPRDERIVVPKRNPGFGWTFNFARPGAYFLLLGIIGAMALGTFLVKKYG